jgi:uncharacterized protein YdhG (YjbR/CyaY superfamily)
MTAKSVDAYITAAPMPAQTILRQLRQVIKAAAPKAEERISYGMPSYDYHGRLVYFAVFKNHVGLYAVGKAQDRYAKELSAYLSGASTARFPIGEPLPVDLIRKVVQARVKENEAAARKADGTSRRKAK